MVFLTPIKYGEVRFSCANSPMGKHWEITQDDYRGKEMVFIPFSKTIRITQKKNKSFIKIDFVMIKDWDFKIRESSVPKTEHLK